MVDLNSITLLFNSQFPNDTTSEKYAGIMANVLTKQFSIVIKDISKVPLWEILSPSYKEEYTKNEIKRNILQHHEACIELQKSTNIKKTIGYILTAGFLSEFEVSHYA